MESTNIPRTNIFINNENTWNWAKFQSKSRGYASVSDYLFQLLENEKENEVLDQKLLIEIEKYFEYNHYSLGDIANNNEVSIEYINNFLIKKKIPLDNNRKAISRIHHLLIDKHLAPREFYLFNQLSDILKLKKDFPSKRELISLFYPNEQERRNEIFSIAFELVPEFSEKIKKLSENSEFQKISKLNPESILYNLGINLDERETIFEDPEYINLKENELEDYYLLAFDIAGWVVISRDLIKILTYYLSNALQIFLNGMSKIKQIIKNIIKDISEQIKSESMRNSIIFEHISILPPIDQFSLVDTFVYNMVPSLQPIASNIR